jgi:hypothetical protein
LLDASFLQEVLWPESTALKHLWRMHPAGAEDNLLLCLDGDGRRAIWSASLLNRNRLGVLFGAEENLVGPVSGDNLQVLPACNRIIIAAACV